MLSTDDASRLTALAQSSSQDADDDSVGAPAGEVYESHSGGILETLTDLMEKAEEQLDSTRKKETQDTHAFEMLKQSLKDEIKYSEKELAEVTALFRWRSARADERPTVTCFCAQSGPKAGSCCSMKKKTACAKKLADENSEANANGSKVMITMAAGAQNSQRPPHVGGLCLS